MKFVDFVYEANIDGFMNKVAQCQTMDGIKELEGYYKKRSADAELKDSDDISIRDALAGKRAELESMEPDEDEEEF